MPNIPDDRDSDWRRDARDERRTDDHRHDERRQSHGDHDLIPDATAEIKAMAREGLEHPSTKPVLTGAAVGAVAAGLLPVVTWPVGLVAGAGFMLYKRLRP